MGTRSTVKGYWRQAGNSISNVATPGTFKCYVGVTFLSSQTMAGTGVYLPKGAIPLGATVAAISGGGTDTVDLQLAGGTAAGLVNELVSGTASAVEIQTGADLGVALTADTEIEAGVGLVAGTLNTTVLISYVIADDGSHNN